LEVSHNFEVSKNLRAGITGLPESYMLEMYQKLKQVRFV
jgi:hypothetical protein